MKTFRIVIDKTPGVASEKFQFDFVCATDTKAWDYARMTARQFGPSARVTSVTELTERNPL